MYTATIYKDRANGFILLLKKDNVLLTSEEMAVITKYEIKYKDVYYDSDTYPDSFVADNNAASVTVKPEPFSLPASSKKGDTVELIIYDDADNVAGLVWGQFTLIVKPDASII